MSKPFPRLYQALGYNVNGMEKLNNIESLHLIEASTASVLSDEYEFDL